jgi:hypothetical protein
MFSSKSARGRAMLAGLIVALGVTAGQVHAAQLPSATAVPVATATPTPPPTVPSSVAGWAAVQPNGTLTRGANVVNTGRRAPGIYGVSFASNVAACTYQATIGLALPGNPPTGEVSVAPLANGTSVLVRTFDSGGAAMDLPFHLLVVC